MKRPLASQGGSNFIGIIAGALLKVAAISVFLLLPVHSHAQGIGFDAASSANTGTGTASSLTWPHAVGALGSNRVLIVGVSIRNSASQTVSSVTFNGTGLNLVGQTTNSTNARVEIWRLIAPATGSHNVVVNLSAAARFAGGAASFTGVSQTPALAFGSYFSATGNTTTPTVNVTGVGQGQLVVDTIANANLGTATVAPCVGAGQTQRWSDRTTNGTAGNNTPGAGSTEPGPVGGGTVTMSWRLEGCSGSNNRQWAIGAVALKQGAVITLSKSVNPSGSQQPGVDLTYSVAFTNSGDAAGSTLVIMDAVPANTDFKVGSITNSLGTTGLTVAVAYSNNGGATYVYTPTSGGGGAAAGYDRSVTNIRWTFTGNLSQTSPNNSGSMSFIARIR
jgi:uncharacterized repeat protein (TIGR01451 family)